MTQFGSAFRVAIGAALCLAALAMAPAKTKSQTLGPIINLSEPDPFAGIELQYDAQFPQWVGAQWEPFVAVNPTNPNNIVASWIGEVYKGIAIGASLDGGATWQAQRVPGRNVADGGLYIGGANATLSFAPNGDLYVLSNAALDVTGPLAEVVNKSVDGGLHWSSPLTLETGGTQIEPDKPFITADVKNAQNVYATWSDVPYKNGGNNKGSVRFARTTDGGTTWEPARDIYAPATSNNGVAGCQILVLPDGTLVDLFFEWQFINTGNGTQKTALVSLIRSSDKGQTWSSVIRVGAMPVFNVTDPNTGQAIVNGSSFKPFGSVAMDPHSGALYVVWEDNRLNNGQYSRIVFSMSTDGGLNWSNPIPINKMPTNIPAADQQAFLPTIAVAADGTIGVSYYDFRFNGLGGGSLTDYWLVRCHPTSTAPATDAANWAGEVRLTDSSFNIANAAPNAGELFLGDYEGLAGVGNGFVAVWTQPHGTDPDSIFFRRIGP